MKTIAAILLTATVSANANLIDNGDWTTDTLSKFDWLDLTATSGQSFDEVSMRIATGGDLYGWSYATSYQLDAFVTSAGGTPNCGSGYCGWSAANEPIVVPILNLVGDLSGGNEFSIGLLSDIVFSWTPGVHHITAYIDGVRPGQTDALDEIWTRNVAQPSTVSFKEMGSFLIRSTPLAEVPLPASGLMFMSALAMVAAVVRSRNDR